MNQQAMIWVFYALFGSEFSSKFLFVTEEKSTFVGGPRSPKGDDYMPDG
jgi:hypothetical protein